MYQLNDDLVFDTWSSSAIMGFLGVEYILGLECMYLGNLTVHRFRGSNSIRCNYFEVITTHLICELA